MAAAGSAGSAEGYRGLVGLLKRIVAQHASARYREMAHLERLEKSGKRVTHYRMYEDADTSEDAHYLALSALTVAELDEVLGTTGAGSDDTLRHRRRSALFRIFEAT